MTAMTATTLDMLSEGRLLLGIGVSGPQVVEGWHGLPYGKPLARTREFVTVFRDMVARKGPVQFEGQYYHLPYKGPDATGLGRALKLIHHPVRAHIPLYLGAMGPKNVALAAEITDGWFPHLLSPLHYQALFREHLEAGFARAGNGKAKDFDIIAQVYVTVGDDLAACRITEKKRLALILGGYGARAKNLYVEQVSRYGYGTACQQIQELYLSGRKDEAALAIPDELIDELTLVGPRAHIAKQLEAWKKAGITRIAAWTDQIEALGMLADLAKPAN
jgi:F420-dependent oxidoreductase-like protein